MFQSISKATVEAHSFLRQLMLWRTGQATMMSQSLSDLTLKVLEAHKSGLQNANCHFDPGPCCCMSKLVRVLFCCLWVCKGSKCKWRTGITIICQQHTRNSPENTKGNPNNYRLAQFSIDGRVQLFLNRHDVQGTCENLCRLPCDSHR